MFDGGWNGNPNGSPIRTMIYIHGGFSISMSMHWRASPLNFNNIGFDFFLTWGWSSWYIYATVIIRLGCRSGDLRKYSLRRKTFGKPLYAPWISEGTWSMRISMCDSHCKMIFANLFIYIIYIYIRIFNTHPQSTYLYWYIEYIYIIYWYIYILIYIYWYIYICIDI